VFINIIIIVEIRIITQELILNLILTVSEETAQIKYFSVFKKKKNSISKLYLKLVINVDIKVSSVQSLFCIININLQFMNTMIRFLTFRKNANEINLLAASMVTKVK
jgi:hypothetical protein